MMDCDGEGSHSRRRCGWRGRSKRPLPSSRPQMLPGFAPDLALVRACGRVDVQSEPRAGCTRPMHTHYRRVPAQPLGPCNEGHRHKAGCAADPIAAEQNETRSKELFRCGWVAAGHLRSEKIREPKVCCAHLSGTRVALVQKTCYNVARNSYCNTGSPALSSVKAVVATYHEGSGSAGDGGLS